MRYARGPASDGKRITGRGLKRGQMKRPTPEGPRTKKKRKREGRRKTPEYPHEIIMKEIHGQKVPVKVFQPAWAMGDRRKREELGFEKPKKNPFSRDRGSTLRSKARKKLQNRMDQ